jgi:3-phosphoshikimate 1-carboxyvinyltransferase
MFPSPSSTCRRCAARPARCACPARRASPTACCCWPAWPRAPSVHDLLDSDDTRVMLDALRALGCGLERDGAVLRVQAWAAGCRCTKPPLPGQCRHRDAPADRRAGRAGGHPGRRFTLRGVPRMHERPIGDLVDALRPLGCSIDDLGQPGYPPLRLHGRRRPAGHLAPDPRARRRVQPVPDRAAAGAAAGGRRRAGGDRGRRRADLQALHRDHAEAAGALRHRRAARRLAALHHPAAGSRYRTPGRIHVEGDASSASYFVALGAIAATATRRCASKAWAATRSRATSASSRPRRPWAPRCGPARAGSRCGAAAGRCGDHAGLQPHPRRRDDAGGDGAVRRRPHAADRHRQLAREGDRPHRRDGRRAAQARRRRRRGRLHRGDAAAPGWRAATIDTYDDHRMAMCLSLAAFNPLAGADPPQPVRILDPKCVGKTFPDYFEALFGLVQADAAEVPVITIDGPTASGKGTLAAALARAAGLALPGFGRRLPRHRAGGRRHGVALDDEAGLARMAAGWTCASTATASWLRGRRDVADELRRETPARWPRACRAAGRARGAARPAAGVPPRPGLVADGRDMGTVVFPHAALKVFLTASAAERAARRHKQLISKGIQASIADLRADIEARDARDQSRAVRAPEAGRRRAAARQLGARHRSIGRCSAGGGGSAIRSDQTRPPAGGSPPVAAPACFPPRPSGRPGAQGVQPPTRNIPLHARPALHPTSSGHQETHVPTQTATTMAAANPSPPCSKSR